MRFLFTLTLLLISTSSYGFGRTGHGLICDMAYQMLSPAAQQQVDLLVSSSPYEAFAPACVWPDEVRRQDEFRWSAPHHYVNLPRGEKIVKPEYCPEQGCVLSAIADMQQRLQQDRNDWQAFLFLVHHVGDLHQPLHVSYADDLGGNRTAVYFLSHELPTNLHGVWDSNILRYLGYDDQPQLQQQLLQRITPAQQQAWQQGPVIDWANESAAITYQIYQEYRPGMLIDRDYIARHQLTLETRLQQAAVRLAALLEPLLTDNGQ